MKLFLSSRTYFQVYHFTIGLRANFNVPIIPVYHLKQQSTFAVRRIDRNNTLAYNSGWFRGAELPTPSLGDGLTPSLTVMLANAKYWSFYCKTWYSEYSKWFPSVAFWEFYIAPNSFSSWKDPGPYSPRASSWLKGPSLLLRGRGRAGRGPRGKEEKKGRGREREGPPPRKFLDPPLYNIQYLCIVCLFFVLHCAQ